MIKSLWKSFYIGLIATAIIMICGLVLGGIITAIFFLVGLIFSFSKILFTTLLIIGSIVFLGALIRKDLGG